MGFLSPKGPKVFGAFWWHCCLIALIPSPLHRNRIRIWRGGRYLNLEINSNNKQNLCPDHCFLQHLRLCNQGQLPDSSTWFCSLPRGSFAHQPARHPAPTWISVVVDSAWRRLWNGSWSVYPELSPIFQVQLGVQNGEGDLFSWTEHYCFIKVAWDGIICF